jgi:hypothetical protein
LTHALLKIVKIERVAEVQMTVHKEEESTVQIPVVREPEKVFEAVQNDQLSEIAEPIPVRRNPTKGRSYSPPSTTEKDPGGNDPPAGPDQGLGSDKEPDPGVGNVSSEEGDRNRGHGNDEDGYDEDNPGRGGFGGLNEPKESKDKKSSGHSGKCGDSGGRGGGKGKR